MRNVVDSFDVVLDCVWTKRFWWLQNKHHLPTCNKQRRDNPRAENNHGLYKKLQNKKRTKWVSYCEKHLSDLIAAYNTKPLCDFISEIPCSYSNAKSKERCEESQLERSFQFWLIVDRRKKKNQHQCSCKPFCCNKYKYWNLNKRIR